MKRIRGGFTLPEIMITVSILALLMALVLPSLTASRKRAINRLCQNNISLINKALHEYMVLEGVDADDDATGVYVGGIVGSRDAFIEEEPLTPVGELSYTITTFGAVPTCPNRDADPTNTDFSKHIMQ